MTKRPFNWRLACVLVLILAAFGGLSAKLFWLHLNPNDALRLKIQKTLKFEHKISVGRGSIMDRNGAVMAADIAVRDVKVDPGKLNAGGHVQYVAEHLARMLDLDLALLLNRLQGRTGNYAPIKRFVPADKADEIRALNLPCVHFDEGSLRNYPGGAMMAHVVGFSNLNGEGSGGVEQRYNSWLRGVEGYRISEKDAHKREIFSRRSLDIPPQEGSDLYLTLDSRVQYYVEKALHEAMEEHHAAGAWAIVQRVRTGEILAMASLPDFDLNHFGKVDPEVHRNRAISFNYEPGSTFKVAVIAAALNEGIITQDEVFDCENGTWHYGGRPLRDYHPYGLLSVQDIIKKSSNIGAAKIALKLGEGKLEKYLRDFGVGRFTGIDLPGEEGCLLYSRARWSKISVTRIAMGHEVAVTAMQMLSLISAIANDGFLMRPYVVGTARDCNGRIIYRAEPEVVARPISQETAAQMRRLMARVTEQGGTGSRAALAEYTVAGKTGSAQKPVPGGYSDSAHMASFVGFIPAENPEISIIVVVDEPQPLHTGGVVAAPVFKKIAEPVMRYLASRPAEWHVVGGASVMEASP
ncbi:MAG: penicillin-binding protein 2 [Kiritimatiellae bacterium]|nr:penicillin-binding protein 2 [Kiritimatiellia bacterium]